MTRARGRAAPGRGRGPRRAASASRSTCRPSWWPPRSWPSHATDLAARRARDRLSGRPPAPSQAPQAEAELAALRNKRDRAAGRVARGRGGDPPDDRHGAARRHRGLSLPTAAADGRRRRSAIDCWRGEKVDGDPGPPPDAGRRGGRRGRRRPRGRGAARASCASTPIPTSIFTGRVRSHPRRRPDAQSETIRSRWWAWDRRSTRRIRSACGRACASGDGRDRARRRAPGGARRGGRSTTAARAASSTAARAGGSRTVQPAARPPQRPLVEVLGGLAAGRPRSRCRDLAEEEGVRSSPAAPLPQAGEACPAPHRRRSRSLRSSWSLLGAASPRTGMLAGRGSDVPTCGRSARRSCADPGRGQPAGRAGHAGRGPVGRAGPFRIAWLAPDGSRVAPARWWCASTRPSWRRACRTPGTTARAPRSKIGKQERPGPRRDRQARPRRRPRPRGAPRPRSSSRRRTRRSTPATRSSSPTSTRSSPRRARSATPRAPGAPASRLDAHRARAARHRAAQGRAQASARPSRACARLEVRAPHDGILVLKRDWRGEPSRVGDRSGTARRSPRSRTSTRWRPRSSCWRRTPAASRPGKPADGGARGRARTWSAPAEIAPGRHARQAAPPRLAGAVLRRHPGARAHRPRR